MIKKLKTKLLVLSSMLLLAVPMAVPVAVLAAANPQDAACQGADKLEIPANGDVAAGACSNIDSGNGGTSRINDLIRQAINIFSVIVGVVAVIMIILGGFRYITSGGDSTKVGSAKNTILYALIGLIIVALAQIVVRFVLSKATGTVAG